jgi:hypothetical protein
VRRHRNRSSGSRAAARFARQQQQGFELAAEKIGARRIVERQRRQRGQAGNLPGVAAVDGLDADDGDDDFLRYAVGEPRRFEGLPVRFPEAQPAFDA